MDTDVSIGGHGELGRRGARARAQRTPSRRPPPRPGPDGSAGRPGAGIAGRTPAAAGGSGPGGRAPRSGSSAWGAGGSASGSGGSAWGAGGPVPEPWGTADGHRLHLPPHRLAAMAERILSGGAAVPAHVAADPQRAALARIERIARGALRVGTLRDRASGRGLPVFGARLGGRAYRILVLPRGGEEGEIVAIRPATGDETQQEIVASDQVLTIPNPNATVGGFVDVHFQKAHQRTKYRVRGARVQVAWSGPHTLAELKAMDPDDDLYLITRLVPTQQGPRPWPLYVGETSNVSTRWKERFKVLREFAVDTSPYRVWLGSITVQPSQRPLGVGSNLVRADVEHVLIRHLNKMLQPSGAALANLTSYLPFIAAPLGVDVQSAAQPGSTLPPGIPPQIQVSPDQLYEFGADPFATG
jgi:hypothetical protein